jgi:hypothetical protein
VNWATVLKLGRVKGCELESPRASTDLGGNIIGKYPLFVEQRGDGIGFARIVQCIGTLVEHITAR